MIGAPARDLRAELEEHLSGHLAQTARVSALRRLSGGASHETWAFDAHLDGDDEAAVHPLILRRDLDAVSLPSDVTDEFELLGALHSRGLLVPRPWSRTAVTDAPAFMVIERVAGEDLRKMLARGASIDRRALGLELVGVQAAIHALEPNLAGIRTPGNGDLATREVERWAPVVEGDQLDPEPVLAAAVGWLRANARCSGRQCLVHGDFKANNLLVDHTGLSAILDWEMAHVGDPIEDLAWTMLWATASDLVGGLLTPEEYVAAYTAATGHEVDRHTLSFWEVFALVKLGAIFKLQAGSEMRLATGPMMAMMGRAIPYVERRLADRLLEALVRGAP